MNKLILLLVLIGLAGCKSNTETDNAFSTGGTADSLSIANDSISSTLDDQAASSFAAFYNKSRSIWMTLLTPAQAASCMRTRSATCTDGVRSVEWSDCEIGNSSRLLNGEAALNYSDANCSLDNEGAYVIRTMNRQVSGLRGAIFLLSSEEDSDYMEQSYGGGGKITRTASGWELEILGKHHQIMKNNRVRADVSVRTLSPFVISGGLERSSRLIESGRLQMNHNRARYTAVYEVSNLEYSSDCSLPVSGEMTGTYTGSINGSAQIEFNGCEQVTITENGASSDLTLESVE